MDLCELDLDLLLDLFGFCGIDNLARIRGSSTASKLNGCASSLVISVFEMIIIVFLIKGLDHCKGTR